MKFFSPNDPWFLPPVTRPGSSAAKPGLQRGAFFDAFSDAVPVAVELRRNGESLIRFEHPERALYVFGPEDGSLGRAVLARCHRFLVIPTRHCTNLSAAVYTVLYDRHAKRIRAGMEAAHCVTGGFDEPGHMADAVGDPGEHPFEQIGWHG